MSDFSNTDSSTGLVLHEVEGEMRIHDLDLGRRLGYTTPSRIREIIKRNSENLSQIDTLRIRRNRPENGGRETHDYYLTKKQAIFITLMAQKVSTAMKLQVVESLGDIDYLLDALNSFEVPDDMRDMYVYAIRESESGRIKLGISSDPVKRLSELQTGNSQKLELVAYRKAVNQFSDERELHRLASDIHIRGEWFGEQAASILH